MTTSYNVLTRTEGPAPTATGSNDSESPKEGKALHCTHRSGPPPRADRRSIAVRASDGGEEEHFSPPEEIYRISSYRLANLASAFLCEQPERGRASLSSEHPGRLGQPSLPCDLLPRGSCSRQVHQILLDLPHGGLPLFEALARNEKGNGVSELQDVSKAGAFRDSRAHYAQSQSFSVQLSIWV
ncbi:hypothetical protein SRHO_G00189570 [Serrasalmus rhombeus]